MIRDIASSYFLISWVMLSWRTTKCWSYPCLLYTSDITDIYVNSFQRMLRDGNFRPEELSAIAFGYTKLLEESNEVFKKRVGKDRVMATSVSYTHLDVYKRQP